MGTETIPDPCAGRCCSPPPPPPPGACAPCSAPVTFSTLRVSLHVTATGLGLAGPCSPGSYPLVDLPARDFTFDVPITVSGSDNRLFGGGVPAIFTTLRDNFPGSAAAVLAQFSSITGSYSCTNGYTVGPYPNDVAFSIDNAACVAHAEYRTYTPAMPTPTPPPLATFAYLKYDASSTNSLAPVDWQLDSFSCNGTTASGTFTLLGRIPSTINDVPSTSLSLDPYATGGATYGVVGYGSFVSL